MVYAVYLCGCTDCFLHAIFVDRDEAVAYLDAAKKNPEGGMIQEWSSFVDIDFSDTGFNMEWK